MRTREILSLIFLICLSLDLDATTITVSTDIGFDPIDNTNFLQFAFEETTEDTVIVDKVNGMDWNTGPLRIERNNVTIIFEEGVVLKALPGVFDIFESLIQVTDKNNIAIIGYGATFMMNKQEYIDLGDSEFRHGINLGSASDILIEGLTILDTGGDGILVSRSFQPTSLKNYSENIDIVNCVFTNNYRQGVSIVSVVNANLINCEFSETKGALPEDGIDIEPDVPEDRIENVLISGCRIFNNFGNAIQLAFQNMDDASRDISVIVENTYMANNHDVSNVFAFAEIAATDNGANGVDGFVEFNNCFIESSDWTAVYARKSVESYDLNFTNCVFKDISNDPIAFNNPIFLEVNNYDNPVPRFGGLNFTDCVIFYDENIPFFNQIGNPSTSDGLGNVTGNFFVINPNVDAGFDVGPNPENVVINYEFFDTFPITEVSLSSNQLDYLEEEKFIQYECNRTSNLTIPLAVTYTYGGVASYGNDYNRESGFVIIPANSMSIADTINIIQDALIEPIESLNLLLDDSECIKIGDNSRLNFTITEVITSVANTKGLIGIKVYPNPSTETIFIETLLIDFDLSLIDAGGYEHKTAKNLSYNGSLDVNDLSNGIYFLDIKDNINGDVLTLKMVKQ